MNAILSPGDILIKGDCIKKAANLKLKASRLLNREP
jgi:hypothetical protein